MSLWHKLGGSDGASDPIASAEDVKKLEANVGASITRIGFGGFLIIIPIL